MKSATTTNEITAAALRAQIDNNPTAEDLHRICHEIQKRLIEVRKQLRASNQALPDINCKAGCQGRAKATVTEQKSKVFDNFFNLRETKVSKAGISYFRLFGGDCCPYPPDYTRRIQTGERFPDDFSRTAWTTHDKWSVIMGVKQQAYEYLIKPTGGRFFTDKHLKSTIEREARAMSLADLWTRLDANFRIDFVEVSAIWLKYRHTSYDCETIWQTCLRPDLARNSWSEAENRRLAVAVTKYGIHNWPVVARVVGARSQIDCYIQFTAKFDVRATLSKEELNTNLVALIDSNRINGRPNWTQVLQHFPQKCRTTLYSRYHLTLRPNISHDPFTPEEDIILIKAVQQFQHNYMAIMANYFPNKTAPQLRARYQNILARPHDNFWSVEDDKKLLILVNSYPEKTKPWLEISEQLGAHSRQSCRTRYLTIKKFLRKDPAAPLETLPRRRRGKSSDVNVENWRAKLEELCNTPEGCIELPVRKRWRRPLKPYPERLRAIEREAYDYFKYAYNYRLLYDRLEDAPKDITQLTKVRTALGFYVPFPLTLFQLDNLMPFDVRRAYAELLLRNDVPKPVVPVQLMQQTWSTAMCFRSLAILLHDNQRPEAKRLKYSEPGSDDTAVATLSDEEVKNHPDVIEFRQRLRNLLYYTALLTRIKPVDFVAVRAQRNEDEDC